MISDWSGTYYDGRVAMIYRPPDCVHREVIVGVARDVVIVVVYYVGVGLHFE